MSPIKVSFPSMVNFFYALIPRRNASLEEMESFLSPEWELCNLTVSKIVLRENYCGGCYYVWKVKKSMPVKLNLFNNWTKIKKLKRFLFNCRMSSRLWFAPVYCEFLRGRFNSHMVPSSLKDITLVFRRLLKIFSHNQRTKEKSKEHVFEC